MVNHAVKLAFEKQDHTFDHSFEVKIESRSGQVSKKTCFVVHHTIRGDSMNSHMQRWMTDQKLVPWAAVAAEFPVCGFFYTFPITRPKTNYVCSTRRCSKDRCLQFFPYPSRSISQFLFMAYSVSRLTERGFIN